MENSILKISNITKEYPGVKALDNVSIDITEGEIHALVGENGAGKSTLIKLISGAITPEEGTIEIDGKIYNSMNPHLSRELGIEVIYQEFTLIPSLSVAENIFMGSYPGNKVTIDFAEMERKTREVFRLMQVDIDPNTIVKDLTVAYMQLVEIAKAISKNVRILVMDEPTAPLTTNEVDILLKLVKTLQKQGVSIIYVSHRLNEIYELSNRLTIFRDGNKIGTFVTKDISRNELVKQMVGRELNDTFPKRTHALGDEILKVENISGPGASDISFSLKKGEILGVAGLVGAGRTEMARLIFGAERLYSGQIILDGKPVMVKSPKDALKLGIGLVPEDRKRHGVILNLSVRNNITLSILQRISRFTVIKRPMEDSVIKEHKSALSIKTPSFAQKVQNLSGGNQQKVVLSKWLASKSKVLIFDEPTRGIDVGAKQEIYHLINRLSEEGLAIIMISSELEEVIGMSDRIMVLSEGRFSGMVEKENFTQEYIMGLASEEFEAKE